jgi:tetratricopeptide (TPR) repeat protein
MKKPIINIFLLLLCTINFVYASPKDTYLKLLDKKDYAGLEKHLENWQKIDPNNPEVYIAFFNLHLALAMRSGVAIDQELPSDGKEYMTITDPNTAKIVGYMHDKTIYDDIETKKALNYLDIGIAKGKDRLDMYFGKTHIQMEIHDFKGAYETLVNAFDEAKSNNGNWLWSDNTKIDNGTTFFIENIQDYYNIWMKEKSNESLEYAELLSKRQIEQYKNHSWGFANLGTVLLMENRKKEAFSFIQKAYDLDPKDMVNVNNLANYYRTNGNTEMALKYYNIIANCGNKDYEDNAKIMIKKIGTK